MGVWNMELWMNVIWDLVHENTELGVWEYGKNGEGV